MTKEHSVYNVSARVFVYGTLCTLTAVLALSVFMGYLAWISQHDAADLRLQLADTRQSNRTCQIALERMDSKMELVNKWVLGAHKLRRGSTSVGGQ